MDEESRQTRFLIGMALLVCLLVVLGSQRSAPVQIISIDNVSHVPWEAEYSSAPSSSYESNAGSAAGQININTATVQELEALPGVGEVLAQRIVAYRTAHGPFRSAEELLQVEGIGEKKLSSMRPYIITESP